MFAEMKQSSEGSCDCIGAASHRALSMLGDQKTGHRMGHEWDQWEWDKMG